jgi:hypothetical protein
LVRWIQSAFRNLGGIHPTSEDILAYSDKELGRFGQWYVGIHVCRCKACQREAERIKDDLRTLKRMDHSLYTSNSLNLPKGLGELRQAIEDWEVQNTLDNKAHKADQTLGETGLRQLEKEFDLYLGNRATAAFLLKMGSREKKHLDVLVEAESVLRDFLGPSAASAATQRILYTQMLMDRSVQGSLPA